MHEAQIKQQKCRKKIATEHWKMKEEEEMSQSMAISRPVKTCTQQASKLCSCSFMYLCYHRITNPQVSVETMMTKSFVALPTHFKYTYKYGPAQYIEWRCNRRHYRHIVEISQELLFYLSTSQKTRRSKVFIKKRKKKRNNDIALTLMGNKHWTKWCLWCQPKQ